MKWASALALIGIVAGAGDAAAQESRQQIIDRCRAQMQPAEERCKAQAISVRQTCDREQKAGADKRQCALDNAAPVHACFAQFVAEINDCLGWEGYKAKGPSGSEVGYYPAESAP